jgi:hypothetical protein
MNGMDDEGKDTKHTRPRRCLLTFDLPNAQFEEWIVFCGMIFSRLRNRHGGVLLKSLERGGGIVVIVVESVKKRRGRSSKIDDPSEIPVISRQRQHSQTGHSR